MHKALVIAGIAFIAVGKIFLVTAIFLEIDLRQCQPGDYPPFAPTSCFNNNSLPDFVIAGILLAIGGFMLLSGLRWKKTVTTNA